jgi:acyl-CoA synthetase (AMP-forming)/AMP-acid ligase II
MNFLERVNLVLRRDLTLGTLFERLARIHGDRLLVEEEQGTRLTFREAADRVAMLAAGIHERIEPGDRVVVAGENEYDFLLLCMAAARAGGVCVPVNPKMRDDEVEHVIADSGASLVVRDPSEITTNEALTDAVPAKPEDVAAIFYTSGTTGKPKGARLTNRALLSQVAPGAVWPAGLRRDEAVVGLPVAHIMGFVTLLALAVSGIPAYFLPHFRANDALDAIETRRATVFVGVPAMYRLMLDAGAEQRDLRSIRLWMSGADVLPEDLARRFKRMGATITLPFLGNIGEASFAEGYGMVEVAGGVAAKISPPMLPVGLGDFLGFPLPPYQLRVVDEEGNEVSPGATGELLVKGPGILEGYHGNPEATEETITADGWLRTGDLARRGPLGTVFFAGRSKDVIKHGGYSVFAVEVEAALREHPAVADAAVLGVEDARKGGEVPVAAVKLAPGAGVTEQELLAWGRERLSDYKAPRQVRIVDELPRTGTDKVQKAELRELFST